MMHVPGRQLCRMRGRHGWSVPEGKVPNISLWNCVSFRNLAIAAQKGKSPNLFIPERIVVVVVVPLNLQCFYRGNYSTPPKTTIARANLWLEDDFPFGKAYFQVLC